MKWCKNCEITHPDYVNFCYNCGRNIYLKPPQGAGIDRNGDVVTLGQYRANSRYVIVGLQVAELLQPLIDLNSKAWVAKKMSIDESRLRRILAQEYIRLDTVDRILTRIGLSHALSDGTLNIVLDPRRKAV